ncbi:hypothetical protein NDI76_07600 [Halogeometricum sp. S1BR25-6]|uniref:CHAT domain-containing protein n=1 Tax=Halogeometricum salsisoli TaxID=2950536 RepID=A0ABU2GEA3_9EURY|nr:hypothetical protein [Halogeometricum sp. S1BR25-6]MDS0298603.1 hypothetical protein [Halogeometricum sp. S1BR25-6]
MMERFENPESWSLATPETHLELSLEPVPGGDGILVTDPIERHQFALSTPSVLDLEPADPDAFWFPADAAVRFRTDRLDLQSVVSVCVRDDEGRMLGQTEHYASESFPRATYSLELFAPVKTYVRVTAPLTVSSDAERTTLSFGEETEVLVGARSHHKRPATTITTPDDPRSMMRAVSLLGSALKTTSPERSYPTLRGHPPLIERGETFRAPPSMTAPETGVTLELPATHRHVYVAAPLAYYLGATVVEGETPRLRTSEGFTYDLDTAVGYERAVERTLKQTFFLDCLARTEGYYQVDLHERRAVEERLDLDFADLYGRSLAERVEAYLQVPYDAVADHVPEWKLTTHVTPTPDNVELLPFVANDLAIVRTPRAKPTASSETQAAAVGAFLRSSPPADGVASGDDFTRSASGATPLPERTYVQPEETDSLEQAWVGEGTPIGASKASLQAYRNRLYRSPTEGDIGITVVCNDPKMADEREDVETVYGSRDSLPFDVQVQYELTRAELRDALAGETDFFHYIGHIDDDGFHCSDGTLDAATLSEVGTDAFLLNACRSYEQGMHLIEAGAIAGIVTLDDVVNSSAVEVGSMLARLLNGGFPVRTALEILKKTNLPDNDYLVVGDGGHPIAQTDGAFPNSVEIEKQSDGSFELIYHTYPAAEFGMGSLVQPLLPGEHSYYLSSGTANVFTLSEPELRDFLNLERVPLLANGSLYWSDEFSTDVL